MPCHVSCTPVELIRSPAPHLLVRQMACPISVLSCYYLEILLCSFSVHSEQSLRHFTPESLSMGKKVRYAHPRPIKIGNIPEQALQAITLTPSHRRHVFL
jgi:hypothetical protein